MARTTLQQAVYEQLGSDSDDEFMGTLRDVQDGGASGGFPGFTYYKDTVDFYENNTDEIWDALVEDAESLGHKHPMELIATFGGAKDVRSPDQFCNLLAWYALERVANELVN